MTKKLKLFCDEYLIDLNGTQAAIRAGYSPKTAKAIASENLTKPDVRAYIDRKMAERSKRTGVNADRVIEELARVAFVNAANVIDAETATLRPDVTADDTAAIQSVKVKTFGEDGIEREIKLADKLKALELLGKHLGMFKDNINLEVKSSEKLDDIISQMGGEGLEE